MTGTSASAARRGALLRLARVTITCMLVIDPRSLAGQLRPIDPIGWDVLDPAHSWIVDVGVGVMQNQLASLAGTRGDLVELGNFRVAWRSGRIGVEIAGTLLRRFRDGAVFADPVLGANPPDGETRHDAGDVRAATTIRLNGASPVLMALRFGTRLPTTSEEVGLDRDRTDFFATFGARYRSGPFSIGGESGVAINGTRVDGVDQLDVWTYSLGIDYRFGPVTAGGAIVGHNDMHRRVIRGNEDLNELRLGLGAGDRVRFAATFVQGLADFSPDRGLLVSVGLRN